ncbi:hypothetical protein NQ315_010657 [Exocentrus adspersus]|uniref:Uncharacterized protein n=1 Tax=Exocentrus adspersus TaxID=1586481 RepID=A0AAV8W604_9CUCU|nr:hypothetical protein NQ315_010657 [Exocentrus adspersus]
MNLTKYELKNAPSTVYYIPNFITESEEADIIKNVYTVPKPKWTVLSNRRLQDYGGVPHEKGMILERIPSWLQTYTNKIDELNVFEENDERRNKVCDLLLERRSLVIIKDKMYSNYLHSISETTHDVISSTCANLLNCSSKYSVGDTLTRATRISLLTYPISFPLYIFGFRRLALVQAQTNKPYNAKG